MDAQEPTNIVEERSNQACAHQRHRMLYLVAACAHVAGEPSNSARILWCSSAASTSASSSWREATPTARMLKRSTDIVVDFMVQAAARWLDVVRQLATSIANAISVPATCTQDG